MRGVRNWTLMQVLMLLSNLLLSTNWWEHVQTLPYSLAKRDGYLVTLPSKADEQAVIRSWSTQIGKPTLKVPFAVYTWKNNALRSIATNSQRLAFRNGIQQQVVTFQYVKHGKKVDLVNSSPATEYVRLNDAGEYVVSVLQMLFKINLLSHSVMPMLADHVGAYWKNRLDVTKEQKVLIWGANPSVNPARTELVYFTNREGVLHPRGNVNGQLWAKSLHTSREHLLYTGTYEIMGWDATNRLYVLDDQKLVRIDVSSGKKVTVRQHVPLRSRFVGGNLYVPIVERNQLLVQNVNSHRNTYMEMPDHFFIQSIQAQENSEWSTAIASVHRPSDQLIVFQIKTLQKMMLEAPTDERFVRAISLQSGRLLIVTESLKNGKAKTYIWRISTPDME